MGRPSWNRARHGAVKRGAILGEGGARPGRAGNAAGRFGKVGSPRCGLRMSALAEGNGAEEPASFIEIPSCSHALS